MILSYYDTTFNDNVIDEIRDVITIRNFSSTEILKASSYEQSPGIDVNFQNQLINLGRRLGFTNGNEFSISLSNMDDLLRNYFNQRNLKISTHNAGTFTNKINFCKQAIDSNNPVIIQIRGTDESIDDRNLNHAVVGYGYDDSGIYVNFGWRNRNTSKVNINNYTISNAFYIELNEDHVCSNNYLWNHSGDSGSLCPCGSNTCNHLNKTYVQYNSSFHKEECNVCGMYTLLEHNPYETNGIYVCRDCGYEGLPNHNHSLKYTAIETGKKHLAICDCGYHMTESCIGFVGIDGRAYCSKCGQVIGGGGGNIFLSVSQ